METAQTRNPLHGRDSHRRLRSFNMLIPMQQNVDMKTPPNQPRLFHAGDQWLGPDHPHILIRDDALRLIGSLDAGVTVDPDFGTYI
jgi:hypothetical protein